jgi:hypothetical protein
MSQARDMGVSEEWIEKTETADPERHQLFMVRKVDSGHGDSLNEGDVLLTLNGKLVTRSPDLDVMYNHEFLDAVVVRKREEKTIKVLTVATEDLETDRIVSFCGATFHRPHQAVRQRISKIHSDVYISSRARGSPAYMYSVSANLLFFYQSLFIVSFPPKSEHAFGHAMFAKTSAPVAKSLNSAMNELRDQHPLDPHPLHVSYGTHYAPSRYHRTRIGGYLDAFICVSEIAPSSHLIKLCHGSLDVIMILTTFISDCPHVALSVP